MGNYFDLIQAKKLHKKRRFEVSQERVISVINYQLLVISLFSEISYYEIISSPFFD